MVYQPIGQERAYGVMVDDSGSNSSIPHIPVAIFRKSAHSVCILSFLNIDMHKFDVLAAVLRKSVDCIMSFLKIDIMHKFGLHDW